MSITTRCQGDLVIVTLDGELNAMTSPALKSVLIDHAVEEDARVIVDLSAVPFIDSSGLGALVAGLKASTLAGSEFALAGLQKQARMIFELTTADQVFAIFPTLDDALRQFAA
jgi:anti-anti-sigma factor